MSPHIQQVMSRLDMEARTAGVHCGVDYPPFITTYKPIAGWKAVMYWWNPEGFWEPWDTSISVFGSKHEAELFAQAWADSEGIEFTTELAVQ